MAYCGTLSAQVSIYDVVPENGMKEFENDLKYQAVDAEYYSDAVYRAERRAIRKERNTIDFTSNLHGSLTDYSDTWQAAGDNTMALLANANFLHTYKNGRFSLSNTASAKFGWGGWMDQDTEYQEYTLVIYLSDTTLDAVHAAADELVETFRQSSILIQTNPTKTEFYSPAK